MVEIDNPRLFSARYYLNLDAGFGRNLLYNLRAVFGIAHGRSGARAHPVNAIDFHQQLITTHEPNQVIGFFVAYLALGEYIEAKAKRHSHQEQFVEITALLLIAFYEQTHRVGTYIYSSVCHCLSVSCVVSEGEGVSASL